MRGITQGTSRSARCRSDGLACCRVAIAGVVAEHPGLRVATVEGSFETLAAGLRAGDLDFILGALRPADFATDLRGEALLDDELAIVGAARAIRGLAAGGFAASRPRRAPAGCCRASDAPTRTCSSGAGQTRGLPPPDVVVETSDLAVLRGVLLESDLLTAISPRQLSYEFDGGCCDGAARCRCPKRGAVIGITQRTDSLASPGAKLLMAEIRRLCPMLMEDSAATAVRARRGR